MSALMSTTFPSVHSPHNSTFRTWLRPALQSCTLLPYRIPRPCHHIFHHISLLRNMHLWGGEQYRAQHQSPLHNLHHLLSLKQSKCNSQSHSSRSCAAPLVSEPNQPTCKVPMRPWGVGNGVPTWYSKQELHLAPALCTAAAYQKTLWKQCKAGKQTAG